MEEKMKKSRYILSEEELSLLHEIELELIEEVDRICKKCNIKYNMVGGTMLGAIRHRGFIPWDDDADIGFLRSEYEKFRKACETELDKERFYIQDIRDTDGYRWGYGKLRRKNTKFVRLNQEFMPYEQGVFIDLMPFDNIPDGRVIRKLHFVSCFIMRKILWSEVGIKVEKKYWKRQLYSIVHKVTKNNYVKLYQGLVNYSMRLENTHQVRILTFPTPNSVYGYDREWYTELSEYGFERLLLPGVKDYDGYLKVKYKNYMDLPPIEKRKVHPISELQLIKYD